MIGESLERDIAAQVVSRAFHTSPIPPAPMAEWISYGPRRTPAARVMTGYGINGEPHPHTRSTKKTGFPASYGTVRERTSALTGPQKGADPGFRSVIVVWSRLPRE